MRRTFQLVDRLSMITAFALVAASAPARAYTVKHTETGATVRWPGESIVIGVSRASGAGFGGGRLNQAMDMAAEAWAPAPGVPLVSVEHGVEATLGYSPRGNRNVVVVPDAWTFTPGLLAVTVSTFDTRSGVLLDADIAVNRERSFATYERETPRGADYDLPSVMTHELGHVLGLGESRDDRAATMWPTLSAGSIEQRTLTSDDEAGIEAIYVATAPTGSVVEGEAAGAGCSTVGTGGTRSGLGWLAVACALAAIARRKQRGAHLGLAAMMIVATGCYSPQGSSPDVAAASEALTTVEAEDAEHEHAVVPERSTVTLDGRVERVGTFDVDGVLWTTFRIDTNEGTTEFIAPGGREGDIEQTVSGFELPGDGLASVRLWHDGWNYQLSPETHPE